MRRLVFLLVTVCACSSPSDPLGPIPDGGSNADTSDGSLGDGMSAPDAADLPELGPDLGPDVGPDADVDDMGQLPPITFADYCDGIGRTYLNWLAMCYGSQSYDVSDLTERARFAAGCFEAAESVNAGRITYDEQRAANCIAALEVANCDRFAFFEDEPACAGVTAGAQAEGDSCYVTAGQHFSVMGECSNGFCPRDTCPSTCAPFRTLGQPCNDGVCEPSTYCDFDLDRCESFAADGDSCATRPCAAGLECRGAGQTCREPLPLGSACDNADDRCAFGTFCSSGTCLSKVARGEECQYGHHCPDGDTCLDPDGQGPGTDNGTCAARASAGGTCYQGNDCMPGHRCEAESCVALPVAGAPCDADRCGVDHWCRHETLGDTGVCQPLGAQGMTCAHGYEDASTREGCQEGLFCLAGTCLPPGAADQPCTTDHDTCVNGLFCSRTSATCQPLGNAGAPCNPFWFDTCVDGLGCHCAQDDATCEVIDPFANPGDTCESLRAVGDACWRGAECTSGGCFDDDNDGTPTCQPGDCLP